MSRSGYTDECDGSELNLWRGAVAAAIRGKRGQAMLRELIQALDALPDKRLVSDSLATEDGEYCALGALGKMRGLDIAQIDSDDRDDVASAFGIAPALAAEVMFMNDEVAADEWTFVNVETCGPVRPGWPDYGRFVKTMRVQNHGAAEDRWRYMRNWAVNQLATSEDQT